MSVTNPKGKLVAQSMLTFLNAFIEDMNIILDKVWTYPLEIHPFEGDLESLTYRFRFTAGTSDREDIAQASKATGDIINIAFKMVAMNALEMDEYPIYLDELGEGYDDSHKINLCQVVNDYIASQSYSSIFLVAQDRSMYEYFGDVISDKIVLSNNNIAIQESTVSITE